MSYLTPAHQAVEMEDLEALRSVLDQGADLNEECMGFTLLRRAIDGEIDGHVQTGEPLHVDTTAYLLARGADPRRRPEGGKGVSAAEIAFYRSHWLAVCLIEEWIRLHAE
jgi:hypothetical protein